MTLAAAPPPALPPHMASTAASSGAQQPFDLKAHAERLRTTPKEHYEAPKPEPEPQPEPLPRTEAASDGSSGEKGEGQPKDEQRQTAKVLFEMYDTGMGLLCEAVVGDPERYPAEHFKMRKDLREQAEEELAKGIARGGGKFKLPWYAFLGAVMLIQGTMTWQQVKKAKKEVEQRNRQTERAAAERQRRRQADPTAETEPLEPDSIKHPDGKVTKLKPKDASSLPLELPICAADGCSNHVQRNGRLYCSQSCAGKATSAKRRAKRTNRSSGQ